MENHVTELVKQELASGKIIYCMLPDDGSDIHLMKALKQQGICRVSSVACRGFTSLHTTTKRSGRLPPPTLYRLLSVVVDESEAEDIFQFLCREANIIEPGRGVIFSAPLPVTTRYSLPDDVLDETVE